jgi:hypothetical protein
MSKRREPIPPGDDTRIHREIIDSGSGKRYVRRDDKGRFTSGQIDVGRSLASDRRSNEREAVKPDRKESGGDRGKKRDDGGRGTKGKKGEKR